MNEILPPTDDKKTRDAVAYMVGKRFGRLLVVRLEGVRDKGKGNKARLWLCRCDCGNTTTLPAYKLKSGHTSSCGCLRRETTGALNRTHSRSLTAECQIWYQMRYRCGPKGGEDFHHYGGRGIYVCAGWDASFETFLADMGPRPSPRHSIDRIDNNGGYTCGHCEDCLARKAGANCRWVTQKEQCRNKRTNRLITCRGETRTLAEWAERMGIKRGTILTRLTLGWTEEEAVTTPKSSRQWRKKGDHLQEPGTK